MKLNGEQAIILMSDGSFQSVNREIGWKVGDKVTVQPFANTTPINTKKKRFYSSSKMLASAAALFLIVSSSFAFSGGTGNKAYASVNIDMQPSIEFKVDKDMNVTDATALNTSGEEMLEQLTDWKGDDLKDVTRQFVEHSIEKGYLCPVDSDVLVSTQVTNEEDTEYDDIVQAAIQDVVDDYKLVPHEDHLDEKGLTWDDVEIWESEIHVHEVDVEKEAVTSAKELGLSPAKYVVYQSALEEGVHFDIKDLKDSSVADLPGLIDHVHNVTGKKVDKKVKKQAEKEVEKAWDELSKSEKNEVKETTKEIKETIKEAKKEQKAIEKAEKHEQKNEVKSQPNFKEVPQVDVKKYNSDKKAQKAEKKAEKKMNQKNKKADK